MKINELIVGNTYYIVSEAGNVFSETISSLKKDEELGLYIMEMTNNIIYHIKEELFEKDRVVWDFVPNSYMDMYLYKNKEDAMSKSQKIQDQWLSE